MTTHRHAPGLFTYPVVCLALLASAGCMSAYKKSVGGERERVYKKIYLSDYNTSWQAVLAALKSSPLDTANRESGFVRTRWIDNTAERNLYDSFGTGRFYLKAQYRFRVSLSKGFYNGVPSIKVTVFKEQMVQRDVLDGWKPVSTDSTDEKTLLYRIGRLIFIQNRLQEIEDQKAEAAIREAESFDDLPPPDLDASETRDEAELDIEEDEFEEEDEDFEDDDEDWEGEEFEDDDVGGLIPLPRLNDDLNWKMIRTA